MVRITADDSSWTSDNLAEVFNFAVRQETEFIHVVEALVVGYVGRGCGSKSQANEGSTKSDNIGHGCESRERVD
jgi:hypothetical protein